MCLWQHQPAYDAVVPDASVRKIILKRRNRVKSFVSLLLARRTGEWVVYDDSGAPAPRPQVHVDHAALLENIALHERFYAETEQALRDSGQDHALLWYEDLFSPTGIEPALALLDAEGRPTQPEGTDIEADPGGATRNDLELRRAQRGSCGSELEAELRETGRWSDSR